MSNLWEIERTNQFKKQYKKLDPDSQKRVDDAITELVLSNNPAQLGEYKKYMKVFAYEMGKRLRLIYYPNFETNILLFIRVGCHKDAYGTD